MSGPPSGGPPPGAPEPISREDWRAYRREMWRHRRGWGPPGRRRGPGLGFGCFFLLFGLIIGSLVATGAAIISNFGPVPAIVSAVTVAAVIVAVASVFVRIGRTLDDLEDATERVQTGEYATRVPVPDGGFRPVRQLARGFNTMVERLERDEDQRRTLLNDVSHELRTPLSVIAGNVEAMIDGVHPADEAHLTAILDEARVMERLIDDLRTVALSEAGTLTLHKEPTDLDLLVGEVVRSFEGSAGSAGVTVRADVPDDLPILDVDPVRIREVLSNLVANGVRHTPSGGTVVVRSEVAGDRLVLRVSDTGAGIDPDLLPHVFERFAKGAGSTGSGLGLAIARNLVVAHGGELAVEATGSAGTTFRVTLPL